VKFSGVLRLIMYMALLSSYIYRQRKLQNQIKIMKTHILNVPTKPRFLLTVVNVTLLVSQLLLVCRLNKKKSMHIVMHLITFQSTTDCIDYNIIISLLQLPTVFSI
jgi:hypothetical protein